MRIDQSTLWNGTPAIGPRATDRERGPAVREEDGFGPVRDPPR